MPKNMESTSLKHACQLVQQSLPGMLSTLLLMKINTVSGVLIVAEENLYFWLC